MILKPCHQGLVTWGGHMVLYLNCGGGERDLLLREHSQNYAPKQGRFAV